MCAGLPHLSHKTLGISIASPSRMVLETASMQWLSHLIVEKSSPMASRVRQHILSAASFISMTL